MAPRTAKPALMLPAPSPRPASSFVEVCANALVADNAMRIQRAAAVTWFTMSLQRRLTLFRLFASGGEAARKAPRSPQERYPQARRPCRITRPSTADPRYASSICGELRSRIAWLVFSERGRRHLRQSAEAGAVAGRARSAPWIRLAVRLWLSVLGCAPPTVAVKADGLREFRGQRLSKGLRTPRPPRLRTWV